MCFLVSLLGFLIVCVRIRLSVSLFGCLFVGPVAVGLCNRVRVFLLAWLLVYLTVCLSVCLYVC